MKVRKVNRYYCDFCKKAGCSGYHLKRHERGCTKNPSRTCGVCKMLEEEQRPIAELIRPLPDPAQFVKIREWDNSEYYGNGLATAAAKALPALRTAANNCPACILAAIRQAGIPVPMVADFSFTKEMRAVWDTINDAKREDEYGHMQP